MLGKTWETLGYYIGVLSHHTHQTLFFYSIFQDRSIVSAKWLQMHTSVHGRGKEDAEYALVQPYDSYQSKKFKI